jgi:hypothetical protein
VLRILVEHKRKYVVGGWIKFHHEELDNLYFSVYYEPTDYGCVTAQGSFILQWPEFKARIVHVGYVVDEKATYRSTSAPRPIIIKG